MSISNAFSTFLRRGGHQLYIQVSLSGKPLYDVLYFCLVVYWASSYFTAINISCLVIHTIKKVWLVRLFFQLDQFAAAWFNILIFVVFRFFAILFIRLILLKCLFL